jgi:hypothetical protein
MRKHLQLGLVLEGNATASSVLRLKSVANELGPIKSSGLQVARRVANFLKAGFAINEYKELETARLILLRVPDSVVPRVVQELCLSELPFQQLSFVLCETWLLTEALAPLRKSGAQVASLVATPAAVTPSFVVEGDLPAVRLIRRLLERGEARTIELRPGTKPLYFAANLLLRALPVPLLQLGQQALRDAGVSGNQLSTLLEDMGRQLIDTAQKGSRVNWGGPLLECTNQTAEQYFASLEHDDPKLAASLKDLVKWARLQMAQRAKGHSA